MKEVEITIVETRKYGRKAVISVPDEYFTFLGDEDWELDWKLFERAQAIAGFADEFTSALVEKGCEIVKDIDEGIISVWDEVEGRTFEVTECSYSIEN